MLAAADPAVQDIAACVAFAIAASPVARRHLVTTARFGVCVTLLSYNGCHPSDPVAISTKAWALQWLSDRWTSHTIRTSDPSMDALPVLATFTIGGTRCSATAADVIAVLTRPLEAAPSSSMDGDASVEHKGREEDSDDASGSESDAPSDSDGEHSVSDVPDTADAWRRTMREVASSAAVRQQLREFMDHSTAALAAVTDALDWVRSSLDEFIHPDDPASPKWQTPFTGPRDQRGCLVCPDMWGLVSPEDGFAALPSLESAQPSPSADEAVVQAMSLAPPLCGVIGKQMARVAMCNSLWQLHGQLLRSVTSLVRSRRLVGSALWLAHAHAPLGPPGLLQSTAANDIATVQRLRQARNAGLARIERECVFSLGDFTRIVACGGLPDAFQVLREFLHDQLLKQRFVRRGDDLSAAEVAVIFGPGFSRLVDSTDSLFTSCTHAVEQAGGAAAVAGGGDPVLPGMDVAALARCMASLKWYCSNLPNAHGTLATAIAHHDLAVFLHHRRQWHLWQMLQLPAAFGVLLSEVQLASAIPSAARVWGNREFRHDHIQTLPPLHMTEVIGQLTQERMAVVGRAVRGRLTPPTSRSLHIPSSGLEKGTSRDEAHSLLWRSGLLPIVHDVAPVFGVSPDGAAAGEGHLQLLPDFIASTLAKRLPSMEEQDILQAFKVLCHRSCSRQCLLRAYVAASCFPGPAAAHIDSPWAAGPTRRGCWWTQPLVVRAGFDGPCYSRRWASSEWSTRPPRAWWLHGSRRATGAALEACYCSAGCATWLAGFIP